MKVSKLSLSFQKGVALFVSLMMLLLITIIGLAGVRMVSLEEKMSANSYDRNIAFQAAEAALREAEKYVEDNKPTPSYSDDDDTCPSSSPGPINNCASGVCPRPDKDCESRWETVDFTSWANATTSLGTLAGTAPQYVIEYMGATFNCTDGGGSDPKTCKRYRVTARSNPGTGRASVILQSIYATN